MSTKKEELTKEWKRLRGEFFNIFEEDEKKFSNKYENHPLFSSVLLHLDKSFRDVNQIAESEIEKYLQS